MSHTVRLAVIGTGGIAWAHAQGIDKHSDRIECVAVCDLNRASRDNFANRFAKPPRTFESWEPLLEGMGDGVDAVLICLPHHLHAPAILAACRARKHVLCEKPMCISLEEAAQIDAAVRESGVIYMSAHNQLFMPGVARAKEMIDSGRIGRPLWARSIDCFVMKGSLDNQWRANAKLQGGGELIDTGYHPSYRLLHLINSPIAAIRCTMGRFRARIQGEDTASVQVRFANGVIGEVLTSWAMPFPHGTHAIHVVGEEGQVFGGNDELFYLPEGFHQPAKIHFGHAPDTFVAQMGHFAKCILEGERPPHSVAEGRAVLELILRASENAEGWQEHAVVPAPTP